jgi:hypothetical protein
MASVAMFMSFLRQQISINMAYSHSILMPDAIDPLFDIERGAFRIPVIWKINGRSQHPGND